MEEIRTGLFSIPKMPYMRSGEVSLKGFAEKFYNLYHIITRQSDNLPWNATEEFGLYYKFSLPFIILGAFHLCQSVLNSFRKKEFNLKFFLLLQLLAAIVLGILIHVNINRINCLHISMIICMTFGIVYLAQLTKKEITHAIIFLYSISFLAFQSFYYTSYKETIGTYFYEGLEDAVDYAMEKEGPIYVEDNIYYSQILFYSRQSTREYVDSVQYNNYPSAFLGVDSFGRFHFKINTNNMDPYGIYIINNTNISVYQSAGYTIESFGNFAVAYQ